MPRLTETKAKTAPLPEGDARQAFTWCDVVRGFGVRTSNTGSRTYVVQTRINGKPTRKALGAVGVLPWQGTEEMPGALDLAMLAINAAKRGVTDIDTALGKAAAQTFTLQQLWDAYVTAGFPVMGTAAAKGKLKQPSTIAADSYRWKHHVSKLASKPVAALTNDVIERWRDGLTGSSRDLALLLLLALFTFAKSRGLCVPPAITVKAGRSRKVQNYLSVDELKRFDMACIELAALQPHRAIGYHAVRVLMRTGMRKGELLALRRDLTNLDGRVAKLAHDKANGDEGRTVLLSDEAVAILRALPTVAGNPYFFPGLKTGAHFTECFEHVNEALKHAGLKKVRVHDLRHSFASAALNNGVSLTEIGKLLGHRDRQSTDRYAHLADEAVRRAADRVANVLG